MQTVQVKLLGLSSQPVFCGKFGRFKVEQASRGDLDAISPVGGWRIIASPADAQAMRSGGTILLSPEYATQEELQSAINNGFPVEVRPEDEERTKTVLRGLIIEGVLIEVHPVAATNG